MTQHTPGPWTISSSGIYSGKTAVCQFFTAPDFADGRLLGSAPELYEALKAAREELRLINMKDTGAIYHVGLRQRMDVVIAKAEGNTP